MTKSRKATITIGNMTLSCYLHSNGLYYFSLGNMKTQLKIVSGNQTGKTRLLPLLEAHSGSVLKDAQVEGSRCATLVQLPLFKECVKLYAKLGNDKCWALLDALIDESIERRADFAFGVVKTELQRNQSIIDLCCNILPNPWEKRFSDEYYAGLSRLTGLSAEGHKRPVLWARLTNEFIYNELPTGLKDKLADLRDISDSPCKLHQYLSQSEGMVLFNDRMTTLLVLMRSSASINQLRQSLLYHKTQDYQLKLL